MRTPSGFHLGARVRITGHPDLTGQVTQVGGSYLWVRVDGQPGAAWMLPRAALEHAPAPPPAVFPDENTDAWEDLAAEVYRAMKAGGNADDIIRAVRDHLEAAP